MAPVKFQYFNLGNLGGRGGVERFFMLANNVPFTESLIPMDASWATAKKEMVESQTNPCGSLPITTLQVEGNDVMASQHIATCRLLARTNDLASGTAYGDYVQDLVADEYHGFRSAWVSATFSTSDEEKEEYKTKILPKMLSKFDSLYSKFKTQDVYLSTSSAGNPLWGDSAIFGILYDNLQVGFLKESEMKESYPQLEALYQKYKVIPAVSTWLENAAAPVPN